MAAIFGKTKFFENWHGYSAEIPCGLKIFLKSLYLARFSRYKDFCVTVLQFLQKIRKFKMAPFLARQNFLKIGIAALQRYPAGQKFHRNRSI